MRFPQGCLAPWSLRVSRSFRERFYVFVLPSLHLNNVALLLVFELSQDAIHLRD